MILLTPLQPRLQMQLLERLEMDYLRLLQFCQMFETIVENHSKISTFFETIAILSNVVGASCKRRNILQEKQVENVIQGICLGEILTGKCLNQETTLRRAGDTHWGSHYGTFISLIDLFSFVIDVLLVIGKDEMLAKQRA